MLLAIFLVVALAGGGWWVAGELAERRSFPAEQQARSKLQEQRVLVVTDPATKHVTCVSLTPGHVSEAILKQLPALYRLESFSALGTDLGDESLKPLAQMSELSSLVLSDTAVSDAGVSHLRHLPGIVSLFLAGTGVTDRGLEHIEHLDTLHDLNLSRTKVTDAGLERLVGLPHLDWLLLRETASPTPAWPSSAPTRASAGSRWKRLVLPRKGSARSSRRSPT